MWILLTTVFAASLLGSLHCVGMCGPFALLASSDPDRKSVAATPTLAYSAGRLITYSVIGLVFGAMGMAVNQAVSFASWQQTATYFAGGLMICVGLVSLARYCGVRIALPSIASPLQRWLQTIFQKTLQLPLLPRALVIGMLTSLMPCGWLYTFGITAAGTGHPVSGLALMVAFWAGTVPIMTALVLGVNHVSRPLQQKIPLVMSLLVILLGIFTIVFRAPIDLSTMEGPLGIASAEGLAESVSAIEHESLPCCGGATVENNSSPSPTPLKPGLSPNDNRDSNASGATSLDREPRP